MCPVIGAYAPEPPRPQIEDDVYAGQITKCFVLMDEKNPALAAMNEWGKNQIQIVVQLEELDDDGNPIELRRRLNISYGQTAGTYSALAQLIQAATGVKCGEKAQRNVTTEQLQGARLRVQTAAVSKDERTYINITGFFAPKKSGAIPPGTPTALVAPPPVHAEAKDLGIEADLSELPW